jgi:hypothetical protein
MDRLGSILSGFFLINATWIIFGLIVIGLGSMTVKILFGDKNPAIKG